MTHTTHPPSLPLTSASQWLFDQLMGTIEPELTSAVYPTLVEKYKEETPEARDARMQRYEQAFELYEQTLAEMVAYTEECQRVNKHSATQARQTTEEEDRAAESQFVGRLFDLPV